MIFKRKKYFLYQFLILFISVLIIYGFVFFNNQPIFTNADQQLTYHPYYEEWFRLIKLFLRTGELPFYSWYKFLGSDFYSSASIYVTSDIFLPILILFNSVENALFFEIIVLIIISNYCFSYFLKTFGIKKDQVILLIAMIYSFSGIAVLFYGNYMFLRFYAFLPLLFAGVELYLKEEKFNLFIFAVFILSFSSLYFMFTTSLFLVFYFYFSFSIKNNRFIFKDFYKRAVKLIIYFLIGFSLSMVLNLPTILYILNSNRIGNSIFIDIFWDFKTIIGFVVNHNTAPFTLFTDIPYLFYSGFNGHGSWYSLYTSSLVTSILITYFVKVKDHNKKYFGFLIFAILCAILIKPINIIFHGFSEPTFRFTFLLVLVYLLVSAYVLDNFIIDSILIGYLTYTSVLFTFMIIGYFAGLIDINKYFIHLLFIIFSNFIGWIIVYIFKYNKNVMIYLVLIEVIFSASIVTWSLNADYYNYEPSLTKEYVEYYYSIDDSLMYRIYIDPIHLLPSSSMNLNQSLNYEYLSVSSYDSAYEPNLRKFIELNKIDWHLIHITNPEVLRMLGVKYFAVYDEDELPLNYDFEFVYNLDFLKVYKLLEFRSIGFTYSSFENIDTIKNNSEIDWNNIAYLEKSTLDQMPFIAESESTNFEVLNFNNNSLSGQINLSNKSLLFLSIPNNPGWKIIDNGILVNSVNVNGGFMGIILNEGYHYIELYFIPKGFKIGLIISLISLLTWLIINFAKRFKNR